MTASHRASSANAASTTAPVPSGSSSEKSCRRPTLPGSRSTLTTPWLKRSCSLQYAAKVVGVVPVAAGRRLAGFVAPPHSQVPVGHRFEQRRRQGVRERGARETREVTGAQARPETGPGVGIDVASLDAHRHRLDLVHLRVHVGDGRPARATRPANSRGTDSMSAMTTSTYDVATSAPRLPGARAGPRPLRRTRRVARPGVGRRRGGHGDERRRCASAGSLHAPRPAGRRDHRRRRARRWPASSAWPTLAASCSGGR